jgi:branched-chain amino acid transport system permease protein
MIGRFLGSRRRRSSPIGILIQVIITGISIGAVYGLFGMALALLYRLTGVVHLALGELAGICVFTTLWVAYGRSAVAGTDARVPFVIGALVGLAVAAALGAIVFLAAVGPFIKRGFSLGWIGGIVASAIALRGLAEVFFPRASYTLPDPLSFQRFGSEGIVALGGGATVQIRVVAVGLIALAIAGLASWLLNHSRSGTALRAISDDRLAAALCGVPIPAALLAAFTVAAVMVAGASLLALSGSALTVDTGTLLGLKGLVAAVIARFGSPRRVLAMALLLGVLETGLATVQIGSLELGPSYSQVIPLALAMLLMALWRERTPLQEQS